MCAGAAAAIAHASGLIDPVLVVASGLAGAAITAAVRALAGDSPASLVAMVLAPLLAIATIYELGIADARELIAIAAAAWTCVELSRPSASPLVALLPASVAGILDPAFAAMIPIASARVMTAPWPRPRWAIAIPLAGAIALVVRLALHWREPHTAVGVTAFAALVASALGPLTATAALAGLASLARARHAEIALAFSIVLSCGIGVQTGVVAPPLVALAALSAGLAVGRLAAQIKLAPGQAFAGATASMLLLLAPAWSAIVR